MTRSELLERAKPILFNTDMVRAIQDGNKSATRRVLKPQPYEECIGENIHEFVKDSDLGGEFTGFVCLKCGCGVCAPHSKYPAGTSWIRPKYKVGDILYVRETWQKLKYRRPTIAIPDDFKEEEYVYLANGEICNSDGSNFKWKPSIHMPKEAARIFLRVTDVRVERLQDIITGDYKTPLNINKEGVITSCSFCTHHNGECKDFISQHSPKKLTCKLLEDFTLLWDSTIKKSDLEKYGWAANPWVWVIEFEIVEVTE